MNGPWLYSYIALWILLLVVVVVLVSVMRNMGILYDSLSRLLEMLPNTSKLADGDELPGIALRKLDDQGAHLYDFRGLSTAFFIISPTCGACHELLKRMQGGVNQPDLSEPIHVDRNVVICLGDQLSTTKLLENYLLRSDLPILIDPDRKVAKVWGVNSTPTTIVVDDKFKVTRQIFGLKEG